MRRERYPAPCSWTTTATASLSAQDTGIPGVQITLIGNTTYQNKAVNVTALTDANGNFTFLNVQPGTYEVVLLRHHQIFWAAPATISGVSAPMGVNISGLTDRRRATDTRNFTVGGLLPKFVSLQEFLPPVQAPVSPFNPAGSGQSAASARPNSSPFVKTAIANFSVGLNNSSTMIDLAGHFSDPDLANSQVTINVNGVPIQVTLFDSTGAANSGELLRLHQQPRLQ